MLQQSDINALLTTLVASQETGTVGKGGRTFDEVKIYDFTRPDNLPSEFLRALENINVSFARAFAGMLTGFLGIGVQVDPLSVDQMTYRQFCNSVPEVTAIGTFTLNPLDGYALLEVNSHIAWYVIDRGLGGQGEMLDSPREFTPLEKGLLDDLFRRVLRELGKAWEILVPLRPSLREVLSNATIARIAQPDDRLVVCSFGISLGGVTGIANYALPVSSLDFERLLNADSAWDDQQSEEDLEHEHEALVSTLLDVPLEVRACLRDNPLSLGELALLRPGDVVYLDSRANDPVEVRFADRIAFLGRPVVDGDAMAVKLEVDMMEGCDDGFA